MSEVNRDKEGTREKIRDRLKRESDCQRVECRYSTAVDVLQTVG